MYIHRIVIDANRINTRSHIAAMNGLEAFHAAGLVEIFQTSTLQIEFRRFREGQQKSRNYAVIGGGGLVYLTEGNVADSYPGTAVGESRFMQIHHAIFGEPTTAEEKRIRDMRDVLHIDQANQNDADFFVTGEKAILNAASALSEAGISTRICTAEVCENEVRKYFESHYGTSHLTALSARLREAGPILIGSNSCGAMAFADNETGENLLAFVPTTAGVGIQAMIHAADGRDLLTITPSQPLLFHGPGAEVLMEVGPAPLLVGDKECRSFSVAVAGSTVLAGRILRNGKLFLYKLAIYSASGRLALHVARDALTLS